MNVICAAAVTAALLVLVVLCFVEAFLTVWRRATRKKHGKTEQEFALTSEFWRAHDTEIAKLCDEVAAAEDEADRACDDVLKLSAQLAHLRSQLAKMEKETQGVDQKRRDAAVCQEELAKAEKELAELRETESKLRTDIDATKTRIVKQNDVVQKLFEPVPFDIKLTQLCTFWQRRLASDLRYKQDKTFDINLADMFPDQPENADGSDEDGK